MAKRKTKVIGTEHFINSSTGEIIPMHVIETNDPDVDVNFHKLFMRDFLHSLDIISNQKTKVAYWIIDNINSNNQLLYSYRQISEKSGISYETVARTVKALKDADFLRQDGKILIVNPDIIFKGTARRRLDVLHRYQKAETGNLNDDLQLRINGLQETISKLTKQRDKLQSDLSTRQNNEQKPMEETGGQE